MTLLDFYRLAEQAVPGQRLPMMLFPIGTWKSAKYPKLPLTRELAEELIANFEAGILGTEPVIDSSGRHDTSTEAAGWMKRLYIAPLRDGGEALFADWEPTDLGAQLLNERRYQYNSVEIGEVVDNATGKRTANVLRSATLTNTPVLRMLPAVLEAGERIAEPVSLALSEFEAADDPVSSILADMEALAGRLDEALKGKKGIPTVRTFLREIRAKVGAHKLSEDDESPESTPLSEPPVGATAEAIGDGASVANVGQSTTPKESKHMSELTELLKLSEDADEALMLAEVRKVITERDTAVTELAESKRTAVIEAVTLALEAKIKDGFIAPAERDGYLALAEADAERATKLIAGRQHKVLDLDEHGSGEQKPETVTYANASIELAERAKERKAADGLSYAEAERLVLAADAELAQRYTDFRSGKEA
jgi:hypothetical protein